MWKNFFYFSGSQRAGIVLLLILISVTVILNRFLPVIFPSEPVLDDSVYSAEFEKFKSSLVTLDSLDYARWKSKYPRYDKLSGKLGSSDYNRYELFDFDPNTLDSVGFVKLGLKSYIASNILKFRSKGGKFKNSEDFSKVYGLKPEKYNELSDYIHINLNKEDLKSISDTEENFKPVVVELNSADSASLLSIKGVGKYFAQAILHFRLVSGGYYAVEQLNDIRGMTPELYEKISAVCSVNPSLIRKIKINTASIDKLKSHPYLNFYQSKQIYELRRRKGKLSGIQDLEKLSEMDQLTLEKVGRYFNFE